MKFVDEAPIIVEAGKGGDGCSSFRREKFIPFGGPDGGDGGNGGSIYLEADPSINTLVDFRYQKQFIADSGKKGMGAEKTGRSGQDLFIKVPVGTLVYDAEHQDFLMGDLANPGEKLCVAQGGFHGLGNLRFKSSINRAPTKATLGKPGERRVLKLELKLLADIGLVGMPNAGKSTLLSVISAAKPKIANYPFTTLYPNLGVIRLGHGESFVVADIPGLIEGASEGAGLGVQFLKHIQRTRMIWHLIDLSLEDSQIIEDFNTIERELGKFDADLLIKPRKLVFNKLDVFENYAIAEQKIQAILDKINRSNNSLDWCAISAQKKTDTLRLCQSYRQMQQTAL